jgi:hypothetical protein
MDTCKHSILPIEISATSIRSTVDYAASIMSKIPSVILFYGATGVGKTTTLPVILSKHLGIVNVLVDSIALRDSMNKYMVNHPSVRYTTKLDYILNPCPGAILVDESHNSDHLTNHLINRIVKPGMGFLTSATSPGASANPKSTKFPIKEILDPRYTLDNIFKQTPLPYLEPSTSGYRTIVFVPNDRDATQLTSRFTGIPVFSITYSNASSVVPQIQATKGPVLIFSSPVAQTGFTLDLDVVIDTGLSNSVEFEKDGAATHINIRRKPSTHLERLQRRGRVGRLRRGVYVSPTAVYSQHSNISAYCKCLYDRLSQPMTKKLHFQLLSRYHPTVTDPLIDEEGNFLFKSNYATSHGQHPTELGPYAFVSRGKPVRITVWDHTVAPSQIFADFSD